MPTRGKTKGEDRFSYILVAVVFLGVVGLSVVADDMPAIILYIYLGASLLTFFVYFRDKFAAKADAWRTPEITLHALSLLGGWPGALVAQQTLRHKSSKASFRAVFWLTVIVNCSLFIWLFTPTGSEMLRGILAAH